MNLKNLPHEIKQLIYSYDDTYKPKRNALWNPIFMDIVKQEEQEPIEQYLEHEEWLSFKKRVYNIVHSFDTMKKLSEENLKVGDIFKYRNCSYKWFAYGIITRMTKKTIFYKFLKEEYILRYFNEEDWRSSEFLYKFNINNIDMKERRMKKQTLNVIDTDKINLNKNFYYIYTL